MSRRLTAEEHEAMWQQFQKLETILKEERRLSWWRWRKKAALRREYFRLHALGMWWQA